MTQASGDIRIEQVKSNDTLQPTANCPTTFVEVSELPEDSIIYSNVMDIKGLLNCKDDTKGMIDGY